MVNFSIFSKIAQSQMTDKMSINRYVSSKAADGTTINVLPEQPLYSDIKCRVSFSGADTSDGTDTDSNPLHQRVKIFCPPEVDLQKGDFIVAQKMNGEVVIGTYEGQSGMPMVYVTHQEAILIMTGDA